MLAPATFRPPTTGPPRHGLTVRATPPRPAAGEKHARWFSHLVVVVGSAGALWTLDDDPLPAEEFDWTAVAERDRGFVSGVLETSDRVCDTLFDVELRTITRRILARVAVHDPRPLRRSVRPERCAAGLVWIAAVGNGALGRRPRPRASLVWTMCRVTDCSDRGRALRRAAGLCCSPDEDRRWRGVLPLGDPGLLDSRSRASLIAGRDALADEIERRSSYTIEPHSRIAHVRSAPARPLLVAKGLLPERARVVVVVGFGEELDDASPPSEQVA